MPELSAAPSINDTRTQALLVLIARLAALDEVAQATAAGLQEVPNDPVLNQYYLSTVGARNATLRQLKGALPVGFRLERY